ncbi:chemotaxis protein CheA [Sporomusa acidovorans]|uniref:Chemotaxis protein CheA n=1 Tax=Sporomusa acidovorans (strain ATCC 49682 / DSM 3132 / Mol) TaxID=1123286 RepID=A0ABZ3J8L7_SPOA4|nr:chemotaxis protein CheA [Sporomusa acidovorans]OZC16640.1 chemotaxis protein CheA [Sporomusa acidovorans DSM 3132]SDE07488.1 two-component system, chemotaxis family, sensor kinase CheA [Sporomusa acidovorans]
MGESEREPMLDMYIFETLQQVEQLEQAVLDSEKLGCFDTNAINKIFRIMHTIKSSAAMMLFNEVSSLAHSLEDLFYFIRENGSVCLDYSRLTDIVLAGIDFFKTETVKVDQGQASDGNASHITPQISQYLAELKANTGNIPDLADGEKMNESKPQKYYIPAGKPEATGDSRAYNAVVFFEDGCEMENIRAFALVHNLKGLAEDIVYEPPDIIENNATAEMIREGGFTIRFKSTQPQDAMKKFFAGTAFVKTLEISETAAEQKSVFPGRPKQIILDEHELQVPEKYAAKLAAENKATDQEPGCASLKQTMISVHVAKLDKLMDMVGELVIAEAMVTQNPDINSLKLDNFRKSSRQLRKIVGELQAVVMSIRMMPLTATFQKMNRIVRDAGKKLDKQVTLTLVGEDTEVDKNIIEKISDPLMHLIRNAVDHGIESAAERRQAGKAENGTITLEAKNSGNDVWIIVKDDGRGLNKEKILAKAYAAGLTTKPEKELTDKEIYSFIFLPGFSTKEGVTELSGRGVGMDVVTKNVEEIGGTIIVESTPGEGASIALKIPLTLAIIDGMTVKVGQSRYTIPTTAIRESFRPQAGNIIKDPDGRELLFIRGQCLPVIKLYEHYNTATGQTLLDEGIMIIVENDGRSIGLFADELLGQQPVVVKALPGYIKKAKGLAGCTLLGDGSISLILDIPALFYA